MKIVKQSVLGVLILFALSSIGQATELSVVPCISEPTEITDMAFVSSTKAILTTRTGELYWFTGCERPIKKIGVLELDDSSWQLGLYSIAVNRNFARTHKIYVYYTANNNGQLVSRLSSVRIALNHHQSNRLYDQRILLEIPQPFENGNGGGLRFGPDGSLYLGIGDGGSDGDPLGNAQNVRNLLGSIIRIRPSEHTPSGYQIPQNNLSRFIPEAQKEIFVYGVRNPWKLTFNSQGDLIIADVGEHTTEEVNIIPMEMAGTQAINLGWNIKEGSACFMDPECSSENLLDPVYEYQHEGDSGNSITGGETLWFQGKEYYLFADYVTGYLGALDLNAPGKTAVEITEPGKNWTTFARSPNGQVYVADYSGGGIYRVNLKP